MLILRPDQKEVLKWFVTRIKEGELRGEFDVQIGRIECTIIIPGKPRDVTKEGYLPSATGVRAERLPGGTDGALNALVSGLFAGHRDGNPCLLW